MFSICPRTCFTVVVLLLLTACGGGGGSSPVAIFDVGTGFDDDIENITPATDGSGDIYLGGFFTTYQGIASPGLIRLNNDGSIDTSFVVGSGFNGGVLDTAVATDGSGDIYVVGHFTTYQGISSNRIIRLNSNGSIDTGFNVLNGFNAAAYSIAAATDGSGDVYVGGFFTDYNGSAFNRIIRLDSDGSIDPGFDDGSGFNSNVTRVKEAKDGSFDIYAAGPFTEYRANLRNRLARANNTGTSDNGFLVGSGFNSTVWSIAPATDGSGDIYVAGSFTEYDGSNFNRIVRLDNDGNIDPDFDIGSGFNGLAYDIAIATNGSGDLYVAGGFLSYNGSVSNGIIRLNSDGSRDSSFDVGTGFDDPAELIATAVDASGDIYVAGSFTAYNGNSSPGLIRLTSTGLRN